MIGVVVQISEQPAAKEFFELFKTPWEFGAPGRTYAVILTSIAPPPDIRAPLVLVFSADAAGDAASHPRRQLQHGDRQIPLYGAMQTFRASPHQLVQDAASGAPAMEVRVDGPQTVIRVGYNLFGEINHLLVKGQTRENAGTATLELHIALLRDLITRAGVPLVEIPPCPLGHGFIACLTHDIDHPVLRNHWCDLTMLGLLYRATAGSLRAWAQGRIPARRFWENCLAVLKLPLVYTGMARDIWTGFDRYLEIGAGKPSTFYFIPERDNPGQKADGTHTPRRACRYEVRELLPQINRITAAGSEVGLHGLDAWRDPQAGTREQALLTAVTGKTEGGIRMHWLYFDAHAPAVLEQAGFAYDSTVGYNETAGYRAGTTQVYRPLNAARLLELPLHIMDTALFYPNYLGLSEAQAHRLVVRMMDDFATLGGALTINWHDRSIAPERLWEDFYRQMLAELQSRRAWFATAAQAVAWFRWRRSAVIECHAVGPAGLRVRCRLAPQDQALPNLRVRLHKPHILIAGQPLGTGPVIGYVDAPLDAQADLSFTL